MIKAICIKNILPTSESISIDSYSITKVIDVISISKSINIIKISDKMFSITYPMFCEITIQTFANSQLITCLHGTDNVMSLLGCYWYIPSFLTESVSYYLCPISYPLRTHNLSDNYRDILTFSIWTLLVYCGNLSAFEWKRNRAISRHFHIANV